jgi:hypothetical protein
MTDSHVSVVVPYSRFVECQDRRHRIAAALTPPEHPPAHDPDALPSAVEAASAQPLTANKS